MLSRRGFLQTMLATAVGAAANFDPLKGLWVPGACTDLIVPEASWTTAVMDEQAELNALALRFAQAMTVRLADSAPLILRYVALEHAGRVDVGTIRLIDQQDQDAGRGHFSPAHHRIITELPIGRAGTMGVAWIGQAANEMHHKMRGEMDAFVPIGTALRRGVPFTDCLVGTGTDPESGLTARALRFTSLDKQLHTHVELAGGKWYGYGARARRRQGMGDPHARILLSPEWTA